jgi:hypothetical protein
MSSVLKYQSVDGERGVRAERKMKMKKLMWRFACNLRSSVASKGRHHVSSRIV